MTKFTEKVVKAIEASVMWKELNEKAKAVVASENRVPSEKEYASLRNFLMSIVIANDENVKEVAARELYETFRAEA
jgi:hypothetical protein